MFFEPSSVNIGKILINNTDHMGNVTFGSNYMVNRNVNAKKTQGFGQQFADYALRFDTIHMVLDEDVIDGMAVKMKRPSNRDTEGCSW